jgi:chromosome segregation ATPase
MAQTATRDPTDVPAAVPDERVDALYGLALDEFVRGRDALAKELRKQGERAGAEWVKGLRKPSAPAWVVNQLARTQGSEGEELAAAGQALREAHEHLLAGEGEAADLREAAHRQSRAVAALLAKAEGLLDSGGHSPSQATLEKSRETLEAVALDEETRQAFALGRLTYESRPVGLGPMGGGTIPSPRADPRRPEDDTREPADDDAKRQAELRAALAAAKEEERSVRGALERAEQEAEQAQRELEQARTRLEHAVREVDQARARHHDAAARVAELEASLEHLA